MQTLGLTSVQTVCKALLIAAVCWSLLLGFAAVQTFAPALHGVIGTQVLRVPAEAFGRLLFFGFQSLGVTAVCSLAYLLSSSSRQLGSTGTVLTYRLAKQSMFASAVVSGVLLALPVFTGFVFTVIYAVGGLVGAILLAIYACFASVRPNPSLQPTCYGWLRQPPQAAELKR
jgi:hypothetical protein